MPQAESMFPAEKRRSSLWSGAAEPQSRPRRRAPLKAEKVFDAFKNQGGTAEHCAFVPFRDEGVFYLREPQKAGKEETP